MAQQSSTMTTFRALVMLTCVLLIPLAAVCGTSFPSVLKAIQSGRLPTLADFRGPVENANSSLSDAPRYDPAQTLAANAEFSPPQSQASSQPLRRASLADSQVLRASYETPVADTPKQSTSFPQNKQVEIRDFAAAGSRGLSQLPSGIETTSPPQNNAMASAVGSPVSQSSAGASQMPGSRSPNPDETFNYIQDRLKRLGATYYLLEAWGEQKDSFRFYCQMPIGGNPQVKQSFQNVDADPLKAMSNVLAQVEDWQKRR